MKKSDKNADKKKKKWRIPKGQVYYSNSEEVTLKGDLEIEGTLIIGYPDNSDDMKIAREVLGTQPVRHHHSEKRSKRNPNLIDQIILYAFDRVIKSNSGIPPGIAKDVWDQIYDLIDNDDFQREEPRFFNCIYEINDESIEYYPHPGQSDDSKFLKRKDFDSRLSRLRKRFR